MNLVRNERLKLFATYLNGLAVAIFAVGGVAPLTAYLYGSSSAHSASFVAAVTCVCLIVSGTLHWAGSVVLGRLQP